MGFSKKIKFEVKKRAHQSCCICKTNGIEIHHIIPQSENGPDEINNAAPLCPTCHEIYGANPTKRNFIKESRDIWYEICENRYPRLDIKLLLEKIELKVDKLLSKEAFESKKITTGQFFDILNKHFESLEEIDNVSVNLTYKLLFCTVGEDSSRNREYNKLKDQFILKFGQVYAKAIVKWLVIKHQIDWNSGVNEQQMLRALMQCEVIMCFILMNWDVNDKSDKIKINYSSKLNDFIGEKY